MRPLEKTIRARFRKKLGREPELENPRGLDDKIQWLKLHDQMPEMVTCSNKLKVRHWAKDIVQAPEVLEVAESWQGLVYPCQPCMVKCNHDSGSWARVGNLHDWYNAREKIERGLVRTYGTGNGEWAYSHIMPFCFTEAMLDDATEYKFHCCEGEVRFVQVIGERKTQHRVGWEALMDRRGAILPLRLFADRKMLTERVPLPREWAELVNVAEALAQPFRYVRVDLYLDQGRPVLGELTFWPMSGMYGAPDDLAIGEMLDFDMSTKREPIQP